ncbi:MAG: hypothetical protein WCD37_19400 [Chloroflexia bacterium]
MELETVACNNCGAPLHISEGTNFVTCGHCGSQLAVRRNESALYTERLEKLEGRTDTIADELRRLKMQQELNQLDDDWASEKEGYMIAQRGGARYLPDEPLAMLGVGISFVSLIVLGVMMLAIPNGFQFMCLPLLLFGGITAWVGYDYFSKLNAYKQGQANYWQRHEEIRQRYKEQSR